MHKLKCEILTAIMIKKIHVFRECFPPMREISENKEWTTYCILLAQQKRLKIGQYNLLVLRMNDSFFPV